jgi:hypothetical protein
MEVMTANGKRLVRVHLLAVTLDLPARAMVANAKQFNGKYGCSICLDEGAGRPNCPMHRYWPYQPESVLRTHQSWLEDARRAVVSKEAVSTHTIYGLSPQTFVRLTEKVQYIYNFSRINIT